MWKMIKEDIPYQLQAYILTPAVMYMNLYVCMYTHIIHAHHNKHRLIVIIIIIITVTAC